MDVFCGVILRAHNGGPRKGWWGCPRFSRGIGAKEVYKYLAENCWIPKYISNPVNPASRECHSSTMNFMGPYAVILPQGPLPRTSSWLQRKKPKTAPQAQLHKHREKIFFTTFVLTSPVWLENAELQSYKQTQRQGPIQRAARNLYLLLPRRLRSHWRDMGKFPRLRVSCRL